MLIIFFERSMKSVTDCLHSGSFRVIMVQTNFFVMREIS